MVKLHEIPIKWQVYDDAPFGSNLPWTSLLPGTSHFTLGVKVMEATPIAGWFIFMEHPNLIAG